MAEKTHGDGNLHKTRKKTILIALLIFCAIIVSIIPAGAIHANSVVTFTDKKTYMGWWVDPTKNGVGYTYAGEDTAPLDVYVYAMVLDSKGLIIKGEESQLSGYLADYKRLAPGQASGHHTEYYGQTIFGNKTLTFLDDGSLSGDIAGDGVYVAKVTLDKTKGATLVGDHMVMNVTVSYPGKESDTQQILISGIYCMNGAQSGAGHAQHTSQTGTSANCAVCHHGYEHWFENQSKTFSDAQLDIHIFKTNPADPDGTTSNGFDANRWNWSDDAGAGGLNTFEAQVPGSKYCSFCHQVAGSALYDYGAGDRTNMADRPSCNNSNCHSTTEISNTTVPAWTQAAMPSVPSTTTRAAYNITNSVKHAHDSVGADTVPCVSCHRTTHSLQLPNRTSTDYSDLSTRCLSCHSLFNKHNNSVSCIKCHGNDSHNIRFLQRDLSYNWSTSNIVTCDNCHTNASFATGSLGLNPPQVPYTNHSGDSDAGQKWGDYWTSDNQQALVGGSNLIQSSTVVVSSQSVQYGSASPLSGAQSVDGSYETLTEGTKSVSPINNSAYVGSTSANLGTVLNFSYMQSADSLNATLREGIAGTIIIRPNATAGDTTTDALSGISYDDSVSENPDTLSAVSTTDNVYTVDAAKVMFLDKFNTSKIPVGATITGVTLHLEYGIEDGYSPATASVRWSRQGGVLNSTGIIPDETALTSGWSGDTPYDLYTQGIDTVSEIADLNIEFTSSDTGGADAIHFDYVWLEVTYTGGSPKYYEMNIDANIDVPYADASYLEIRYYRDGNDTYDLYVNNGSMWNDRGDLTATTMSVLNYTLTNQEYNNGGIENANGSVGIRFVDKNQTPNGTSQGNLYIDYVRVHYLLGETSHQEIYLNHNFTGIPKYAASETSEYTLTVKGYVSASESLDIYAYDYTANSYQLVKAKAFPTTNDWVNWSIPYTAISDSGNASIRFRDYNRSRYDSVANNFWLDYVAIKADNYKYLPCYYCHALLANHLPRALGNVERVQSGPGGNNPKNSTALATSYWCANCHYNGSSAAGSYRYNGSLWSPAPPLVNINNVGNNSGSWYNHSDIVASNFTDAKCKECHGTGATQTTKDFPHSVEVGSSGGANCTNCHDIGGSAGTGRLVNFTAMNNSLAIHKNLNSGATTSLPAENKKCWACHGNGSEPIGSHPTNYKIPYKCVDCHIQGTGQNLNFTPKSILNVSQHYWNGSNITTANATSCYACHNRNEMMVGLNLDPDGAASVYGGANGGSNSTSHYGLKRSDLGGFAKDTAGYCNYCHNTSINNATFFVNDFNNTIYNHSARGTTPLCSNCHKTGRIHNSTLEKPVSNDTYCSTCHGTGGSAATKDKLRHKALNCTECHANNSVGTLAGKDIHAVKYLTQSNTFATSNTSAVNCVTCHQTTTVDSSIGSFSAFKIITPMRHSENISNGTVWDSYWTNTTPQTACIYCHNNTLHNITPLGRILQWNQNYKMYGTIGATNTSCGDCHYKGDSNYTQMNSSFTSAGLKTPPEITNGTNWKGNSSKYYNHSLDTYFDQDCKNCHGSLLSGSANMSEFLHNAATGVAGGANCTACHNIGGTAGSGKLVNFTAINDSNAIHKNLNSGATNSTNVAAENKKCWACHGNGSEPLEHPSNYKTPYTCTSCHVQGVGQNLNFTPQSILNVTQHYWNGTSVNTANATSCYVCHNKTEMILGSFDPDGAGTGVYGGANGGNNSVSHYGKKRNDMAAMANTTYCSYCHNNATSVFPVINATNNRTIANHSLSYPATNPACSECHSYGRLHNNTIYRPAFALPNSTYCLICHGSSGTAAIKNLERHNGTSPTALNCTQCHLNSSKSIHPVRYLQQGGSTWNTSKTNAVNCTSCHQGSGIGGNFSSALKVPAPMNHSTNTYSGALWNNTQPAYWTNTSQQSSCDYCHGKIALHNTSGLGNITKVKGSNTVRQALENSTWCANCHYSGASNYGGTLFSSEPPEITNATGKVPAKARDNTNFYNHSQDMVSGYNDSKCKNCHNNNLEGGGADSLNFSHNLAQGGGGANCTSCHYPGGSVQNINITAINDASSIHKDLNKDATTSDNGFNDSKKCWACHGNGQEPSGHPTKYKTPYNCVDCHVPSGQNLNYTPNTTVLNVTQHYWNGASIKTPAATSCYVCHNATGMIISANDPDGASSNVYGGANGGNASVSHYGKKRSDMAIQQNTTPYCDNCHNGSSAFPFINNANKTIANHSANYPATNPGCKDCHSGGRIHNSTLYKTSLGAANSTYCLGCHGNPGSANTTIKNLERHNSTSATALNCTQCHLNTSRNIHPVNYLQQNSTWATMKASAVNCTSCHQGSGMNNFSSAPRVPVLAHSTNAYSGAMWNSTPGYWTNTSQQSSCDYCHGTFALHNASGLGNITKVKGTNTVRQVFAGGYWCANCHYSSATNYSGTQFNPPPPEVRNTSGQVPAVASDGTKFYNHSTDLSSGYDDAKCKTCHNNNLGGSATSLNFTHSLGSGGGGANCTSCHGLAGTLADGKKVNQTAMNTSLSIHKDLNKDATASDSNYSESKKCWACHGDGTEPGGHPTRYKNPYDCVDCHVQGGGQNFDYQPNNTILNVSQHYWNGTNLNTTAATSCYACHNRSEMMIGLVLDPDGIGTVYGGLNGGNNSTSHYGKKRTDYPAEGTNSYCYQCHSNASAPSVFPYSNTSNATIANHSVNYASTNPSCSACHASGRIHNSTLYRPAFALPNSSYCLDCHGTGGSATIKNLERHNGSTGLNCTSCHLNSTKSIHPVRYLRQNSTWATTNNSAVNCTSCHQGTGLAGFGKAPLVATPIWHSNSSYSGNRWNGSQKAFWDNKSQQSSCDYCHGKIALHNDSGLGNSTKIQNGNQKNQSLSGSYWCANCHYDGKPPSGNYKYLGNLFDPLPPEILNKTGLVPQNASDGMPFQNHTDNVGVTHDDERCRNCHLSDATNSAEFLHKLNESRPEAGGKDCLSCHASTSNDANGPPPTRRINATAFTNYSVHKNLNNNTIPTAAMSYNNASVACWACHGDGTQPARHPANYLNPRLCDYCHVSGNFNATLVYQHYPGSVFGNTKVYDSINPNRTCAACHNNSYVANLNLTYGIYDSIKLRNASVAHYAVNRSFGEGNPEAVTGILPNTRNTSGTNFGCNKCHDGGATGLDYGSARNIPSGHNMMGAKGISCQESCHNSDRAANITLHDNRIGLYLSAGGCYTLGCHMQPSTGGRQKR